MDSNSESTLSTEELPSEQDGNTQEMPRNGISLNGPEQSPANADQWSTQQLNLLVLASFPSILMGYCRQYPSESCPMVLETDSASGKLQATQVCFMYRTASTGSGMKMETGCLRKAGESRVKSSSLSESFPSSKPENQLKSTSICSLDSDSHSEGESTTGVNGLMNQDKSVLAEQVKESIMLGLALVANEDLGILTACTPSCQFPPERWSHIHIIFRGSPITVLLTH